MTIDNDNDNRYPLYRGLFLKKLNRVETRPTRLETSKLLLFYLNNDFYIIDCAYCHHSLAPLARWRTAMTMAGLSARGF
jgi:hypothetical protein